MMTVASYENRPLVEAATVMERTLTEAHDRIQQDVGQLQCDLERIWSVAWGAAATAHDAPVDRIFELRREYQERDEALALVASDLHAFVDELADLMPEDGGWLAPAPTLAPSVASTHAPQRKPAQLEVGVALGLDNDFTSTKPAAFELAGKRYEAGSWQDLMSVLSKLMRARDPARFAEVVRTGLKEGRQRRPMFASNPNELSYDVELGEGVYF